MVETFVDQVVDRINLPLNKSVVLTPPPTHTHVISLGLVSRCRMKTRDMANVNVKSMDISHTLDD